MIDPTVDLRNFAISQSFSQSFNLNSFRTQFFLLESLQKLPGASQQNAPSAVNA
jgi:hypothetical protein